MTESQFINENKKDWEELEKLLDSSNKNPDRLQALFVKVSGDLSYARTFYSRRSVRRYLNTLLNRVFDSLNTREKYSWRQSIINFYKKTLPAVIIEHKSAFIVSFSVFIIAVLIGVFSSFENKDFLIQILGDSYVSMTEENIQNDDPMAVYKSSNKSSMFLGITLNNIYVAFLTFVLGIFASLGTIVVLVKNGIMLGAFQTFFYQKGLFLTSFLTIWIHGTIEISSIIVAGAAGIILGNGLLFSGTYTKGVALREAAVKSLIVLLSTVPLFVVAGFLEGFVTRQTDLPTIVKAGIIFFSLLFILLIYVVNPYLYYKSGAYKNDKRNFVESEKSRNYINIHSVSERASVEMRERFGELFLRLIIPSFIVFSILVYLIIYSRKSFLEYNLIMKLFVSDFLNPIIFSLFLLFLMIAFMKMGLIFMRENSSWISVFKRLLKQPVPLFILSVTILLGVYFLPFWAMILTVFILPYPAFAIMLKHQIEQEHFTILDMFNLISKYYSHWQHFLVSNLSIVVFLFLSYGLIGSSLSFIVMEYLSWFELFEYNHLLTMFYNSVFYFLFFSIVITYAYILYNHRFTDAENKLNAYDLKERFEYFGQSNNKKK